MSLSKDIASELPALTLLRDRDHAAEVASRNPLAGGGWNGLTALSMGCIALAVVTAMLFHARRVREGRAGGHRRGAGAGTVHVAALHGAGPPKTGSWAARPLPPA